MPHSGAQINHSRIIMLFDISIVLSDAFMVYIYQNWQREKEYAKTERLTRGWGI
jgi:hypothetical protein